MTIIPTDWADTLLARRILDAAAADIQWRLNVVINAKRTALTGKQILAYNRDLSAIANLKDSL
jgi:hypothetical protein